MNKSQLKTYAPKARRDFIQMVRQRADVLGLTKAEIAKPDVQGDVAVIEGRPYPRRYADLHAMLARKIEIEGLDQFLDRVAYSWFNRFAALRYMEVNGYLSHPFRVLSNRDRAKSEPEILEHAAEVSLEGIDKQKVIELKLAGSKDAELYKLLLVAQCNELHAAMPFLFERINDETELLLPDNLLHSDSVIRKMVSEIDEENWKEVEIVGWLYQFYISEKKDEVIGKTVKSEDIPAATQLFTPNWIVKYMVQNSLGRLWLEANPDSRLKTQLPMEFYIEPAEDNPKIEREAANPEEITILDPACGSGHILVEAYDVLKAIYTERGYTSRDIPELILRNNLFGLEIDERAAQLAGFSLLMKARADDRNLFDNDGEHLVPNVLAIPDSSKLEHKPIAIAEMFFSKDASARGEVPIRADDNFLFAEMQIQRSLVMSAAPTVAASSGVTEQNVIDLLSLFEQGKTLGSLIRIPHGFGAVVDRLEKAVEHKRAQGNFYEQVGARELEPFVRAGKMLAQKYDCVIANPPYMGSKYHPAELRTFLRANYQGFETDLFAAFTVRNLEFTRDSGTIGMMTSNTWMFLGSYEAMRETILTRHTLSTVVHLSNSGFDGATVFVCGFTVRANHLQGYVGTFIRLTDFRGAASQPSKTLEAIRNPSCGWLYNAKPDDFEKIPGSPIAYWINDRVRLVFEEGIPLKQVAKPTGGMTTGNNEEYLRRWFEVGIEKIGFRVESRDAAISSRKKWFPYNKGGDFRKWYGNNEYLVNWENDGQSIINSGRAFPRSRDYYFKPSLTWTATSSSYFGIRHSDPGFIFDAKGSSCFAPPHWHNPLLGFLTSKNVVFFLGFINPTIEFQTGDIGILPILESVLDTIKQRVNDIVEEAITIARADWDSFEASWDFTTFPLLELRSALDKPPTDSVEECWNRWNDLCNERVARMQQLETENNRLFIEAYGLQDELSPEVPPDQITLARADKEKDTRRLLSYFIGCLMGRYSLDEPGLMYADAGNVGFDSSRYGTFRADDDGIVPVTDIEWFPQEAARQFEKFMRTTWSDDRLAENLRWVAAQLSPKAGEETIETIRRYFSTSFFKEHMQTYKKRPIYWLFSSGKQKAFECLVYLHRYNESTLPRMRHEYVMPLMSKIEAQIETLAGHADEYGTRSGGLIDTSSSTSERNKLTKQLETLKKKQVELAAFDEKLRHCADMRISLDLDDGVKVNYGKFGELLAEVKTITGTKGE